MKTERIVILTWVSASGKSTLQEELVSRWYKVPISYTTRPPRQEITIDSEWDYSSDEMNEYVFLDEDLFISKFKSWHFIEHSKYLWNFYALSKYMPWWNVVLVLDPTGRDQVLKELSTEPIQIDTYFLEISKEEQLERLKIRWDTEKSIIQRVNDHKFMFPTNKCKRLSATKSIRELADIICQ